MLSLLLTSFLTFVQLNCENLFDFKHDSLKQDTEYLPEAARRWTPKRYWKKINNIGQELISCTADSISLQLPDLVALCEVENDSVLRDVTKRSLLRNGGYEYVMTNSPDERGMDVALLYQPFSFALINSRSIQVPPMKNKRPTRDILYVSGRLISDDTLHIFVIHAPSRYGGIRKTRPYRRLVATRLCEVVDSVRMLSADARIIVAGDFNDNAHDEALMVLNRNGLINITETAQGKNGAKGTYRYEGKWESIDHILVSSSQLADFEFSFVNDAAFLLEEDTKYGGKQPRRTYKGYRYQDGYSDHLPLVARFRLGEKK
jgi:endonuclease/exonuclease/phosphatase family metal-dependent hydrolase